MAEVQEHEQILRRYVAEMVAWRAISKGSRSPAKEGAGGTPRPQRWCGAFARWPATIERRSRRTCRASEAIPPSRTRPPFLPCSVRVRGEEDGEWTRKVSNVLRDDYTAFNHAAISYAALCEMGFRLYNPPLREIALRHLRAYAEATQQINQLIASVVAWEPAAARVGVPLHMPHVQHGCLRLRGGRHLDGERGVARDGARWGGRARVPAAAAASR